MIPLFFFSFYVLYYIYNCKIYINYLLIFYKKKSKTLDK